tara:strand:+ start:1613 stop:2152 length:540 start_codon:yes stop_codon:yes gene_type:complete
MLRFFMVPIITLLSACTGVPVDIKPVDGFELQRYLGTWYEIARLDHSFERGLSQVTANYQLSDNATIEVINRGYDATNDRWNDAQGNAKLVSQSSQGHLKVSFFGPFYGSYVIFELDHDSYKYAFVTSYNKEFLWFLARTPVVDPALTEHFMQLVRRYGFDQQALIWVDQSMNDGLSIK